MAIKKIECLKNMTVFNLFQIVFCLFIVYATIDIILKINEHSKYDMQKLLIEIKKEYPKSELTFQNIRIEGNYLKRHSHRDLAGHRDTYFETIHVYIKGNRLYKEPNFLWILIGIPAVIFFSIFHGDPRIIKLKDLGKVSLFTALSIIISFVIAILVFMSAPDEYVFKPYASANEFKTNTELLINEFDLSNFKK